jgi:hypothetical protein
MNLPTSRDIRLVPREMAEVLSTMNRTCGWDCVVSRFDGWCLYLSGGSAPEYAKPFAGFSGVQYVECAFEFSHPTFRMANDDERGKVSRLIALDDDCHVFAIDTETMANPDPKTFLIAAMHAALRSGEVEAGDEQ